MDKPDVDYIEGLSPAISIDQKTTSRNPRSTVGTVTEIYDYLRLLYARIGHPHCPNCGKEISRQTVQQMVDQLLSKPGKNRLQVLAPLVKGKKGEHTKILDMARKNGYVGLGSTVNIRDLNEENILEKNKKHSIEVVIDRISLKPDIAPRLADSLETALKLGEGTVLVDVMEQEEVLFSENFACPDCGIAIEELSPRLFSFNSPFGACPACTGLGANLEADIDLIIPDRSKSINEGAIVPWARSSSCYFPALLKGLAEKLEFSLDTPVRDLTEEQWQALLYGSDIPIKFSYYNVFDELKYWQAPFEGLIPYFNRRYKESTSDYVRTEIECYMTEKPCPSCQGKRLKPEALAVKVGNISIYELTKLTVTESLEFLNKLKLSEKVTGYSRQVLKEIKERLGFLVNVGLDYLTLNRAAGTLSGGEAQRIRLATRLDPA
jgi:excinuclease ABC subunit A